MSLRPTILISAAAALLVIVANASAPAADKAPNPPVSQRAPAEDTARYVAWMASQGKPRESSPMRITITATAAGTTIVNESAKQVFQ